MKRLRFALALLLPVLSARAQFAYQASGGEVTITMYTGLGGQAIIPATVNGLPVTGINGSAFFDATRLTSVFIPSNVVNFGSQVFEACTALTNITVDSANPALSSLAGVLFDKTQTSLIQYPDGLAGNYTIPDGVTNLAPYAFAYAANLTSVSIPGTVTTIGSDAFMGDILTNIAIPASVTSILPQAFVCLGLTNLGVDPANAAYTNVGGVLFDKQVATLVAYPPGLAGSYTIPRTVTAINGFAFEYSSNLTAVTIPTNVISLGSTPFLECTNLQALNVTSGNPAFSSVGGVIFNSNQTTLMVYPPGLAGPYLVPNGVTSIAIDGFYDCARLSGLTFPDTLKTISILACHGCTGLTNLAIPASVTGIGVGSFEACTSLTNFSVDVSNAVYASSNGVLFNLGQTVLVTFPPGKSGNYTIPGTVGIINSVAFADCPHLTGVVIPASVTNILQQAFESCSNLAAVAIPGGVTQIGAQAFQACHALASLTVSNGVTSLPASGFSGCVSLTNVTLPNSITNLLTQAFFDCTNLTTVTIGSNLANIDGDAFDLCTSLRGIYFAGNAPPADTNTFSIFAGDTNLTAYYLPWSSGWTSNFEGIPTALWQPQLQNAGIHFGTQSNLFGSAITWAGTPTVRVEAVTNLSTPAWSMVSTTTLTNGTASFSDTQWTNNRDRFYRVIWP